MPVHFFNVNVKIKLNNRRELKRFLKEIFNNYGLEMGSLSIVFCSDKYLLNINRAFLNHDTFTDIITFPLSNIGEPSQSEIYISTDRVIDNSQKFETSYTLELHRVLFHGVLHLCGFKDKTKSDKKTMRRLEDEWLNRYFT